jgi:sporulation protein YlmC with PRC-barrel domain
MYQFCKPAAIAAIAFSAVGTVAAQQAVQLVVVDVVAVAEGYRASKLINSSVVNDRNERIGTVDDIIISRDRALFTILQVGGFLGIGGKLVAVPYQSLVLEAPGGKVTLPGATKDELKRLPEFKYK